MAEKRCFACSLSYLQLPLLTPASFLLKIASWGIFGIFSIIVVDWNRRWIFLCHDPIISAWIPIDTLPALSHTEHRWNSYRLNLFSMAWRLLVAMSRKSIDWRTKHRPKKISVTTCKIDMVSLYESKRTNPSIWLRLTLWPVKLY